MTIDTPTGMDKHVVPSPSASLSAIRAQFLLLSVVLTVVAFGAGIGFANVFGIGASEHNDDDVEVLWQAWDILDDEYYFDLPPDQKLAYGAVQGLLAAVEDPYTFFVPPAAAEYDRQAISGVFGGIGAYVSMNLDGQLVIVEPFAGLPADEAGLRQGDIILAADGVVLQGMTMERAVGLLRGEIGTELELDVYRPSTDDAFSTKIVRAQVTLPTVTSGMFEEENVAYVRLFSFNGRATELLSAEIAELLANDPRALILDLRGNPGGLLDQAVGISDLFLDAGIVVTQHNRDDQVFEYQSRTGDLAENITLVVLVDGGSASASEVVAGALRDRERAVLIGQKTFGKGSVQHVHDLPDGSQLHVTVSAWYTPDNIRIEGQGLEPDVSVEVPDLEEGEVAESDPFIEAALDYIGKLGDLPAEE